VLYPQRKPDEATANGWQDRVKGARIDFILHTSGFEATAAEIVRTKYDALLPSDHYPVTATLRFD
jgi:endonuclease/exonuclease/phosphatase family metal-dependent hydrolase